MNKLTEEKDTVTGPIVLRQPLICAEDFGLEISVIEISVPKGWSGKETYVAKALSMLCRNDCRHTLKENQDMESLT